ncbi:MAG: MFS transporter [Alistipes sp.]|nr:MFS transporter [Alistipes sp.]
MKINTGKGTIPLITLIAILSVSAVVSLPGLAISPILDDISRIFPHSTQLEVSMLESLPSLMIIPFMLLAGRWSVDKSNIRILVIGTLIFLLSGIWSMLSTHLVELIIASTIMGVGAGMIIPLSTGLIVQYFTGNQRVRQLGVSSAVNNLTLVVATSVVGYLADVSWHLAFVVYLLPLLTLVLIPTIRHTKPQPEPQGGAQNRQTTLNRRVIIGLMLFYFAITYLSLIVTFNTSYLAAERGLSSEKSGLIISLFFLAIMAPGFVLDKIVAWLGKWLNFVSLVIMGLGLVLMALKQAPVAMLWVGAILTGLGYGVMQPVIYDKAATNAPPRLSTLALSLVMVVNYLAILVAPFIIDATDDLFHATHHRLAYLVNGVLTFVLAIITLFMLRRNPVFGSDD